MGLRSDKQTTRREFLRSCLRSMLLGGGGFLSYLLIHGEKPHQELFQWKSLSVSDAGSHKVFSGSQNNMITMDHMIWQIDPARCVQCGQCATHCVLNPSAVKCVHVYSLCGYCKLCFGYFRPGTKMLTSGAENQLCPTGAITRRFIENPYYEYTLDENLCIGCGKCVKGCNAFGNGSLCLQVRHDLCLNCNECAIARACPSGAIKRVPASQIHLVKGSGNSG